jgi:hypothetical protein
MEKVIVFFSDIKLDDTRSASTLLLPLFKELQKHRHIIMAPRSKNLSVRPELNIIYFPLPFYKHKNLVLRTFSELLLPIVAFFILKFNRQINIKKIEKILCYSPSIFTVFFAFLVKLSVGRSKINSYLILRDIFPGWAFDSGLIKNRFVYYFFNLVSALQFRVFNEVGVQDESSIQYIRKRYRVISNLHVLPNWFSDSNSSNTVNTWYEWEVVFKKYQINLTYTGSIGPAQNLGILLEGFTISDKVKTRSVAIHIFGNGQEFDELKDKFDNHKNYTNIFFWGTVTKEECQIALEKSTGALFSLSSKLKFNNVPGKYIHYTSIGIPIFASINSENNIIDHIESYSAGTAGSYLNAEDLSISFIDFLKGLRSKSFSSSRKIFNDMFIFSEVATPLITFLRSS